MTLLALPALEPHGVERRAVEGNRGAWNELVARHQRRVLLSIIARGVPIDTAREVAQKTWLRLYEAAQRGEFEVVDLPGLAIRQAEYFLRDLRRHEVLARSLPREASGQTELLESRILARDALRVVERVIAARPAGQQRIFWAAYEQPHLPHSELAASLGVSIQHLRQTLCDLRQSIRSALQDHDD